MNQFDPLDDWLWGHDWSTVQPALVNRVQADLHQRLEALSAFLRQPADKQRNYEEARGTIDLTSIMGIGLATGDVPLAQATYKQVLERGGAGTVRMQEKLLNLIAAAQEATSIPFWMDVLNMAKKRDTFRHQRRTIALAALARLAIQKDETSAYEALFQASRHPDPEIRGLAIYYLGRAYHESERPLPIEVKAELRAMATQDSIFEPRFQARTVLKAAGDPVPMDNPGGVYAFKVMFMWFKRIYRVIEIRSEQTLDQLQRAIQASIDWNNDHLYAFYMNNQKYDSRYRFSSPREEDRPPWTTEAVIGRLGLVKKHRFLYRFDFGDDNLFEVEVVDIRPEAYEGGYPRVVDSHGKAPEQYR